MCSTERRRPWRLSPSASPRRARTTRGFRQASGSVPAAPPPPRLTRPWSPGRGCRFRDLPLHSPPRALCQSLPGGRNLHSASMVKLACLVAAALLLLEACTTGAPPQIDIALVVDKTFDIKSADPHRELSVTGAMLARALYSTLLSFDGADESTPVPSIARSDSSSEDARR